MTDDDLLYISRRQGGKKQKKNVTSIHTKNSKKEEGTIKKVTRKRESRKTQWHIARELGVTESPEIT